MPELPEVETARRGLEAHLPTATVARLIVRNRQLRWPVPATLHDKLAGQTIRQVGRRGKYLLLQVARGTLLIHLGMSGSLRIVKADTPAGKHDHVDLVFTNGQCLRLRDPRRFGAVLWAGKQPLQHKLLKLLGPEPLDETCNGDYLFTLSRRRTRPVKSFIMDSHIVVGIGNIYASEALFRSGIHPRRAAGKIARPRYEKLAAAIKQVLTEAIDSGGTTLQDFVSSEGAPGYFARRLQVYGRKDEACYRCNKRIRQITLAQRSTFYCPACQH